MSKIIECENITHYYGNRLIYENLSFDVEQGKVLGLLGKNGTGKTTIINILNGYLKPRSGVCRLFGEEMEHLSPLTKSKVGLLLEGHVQHAYFTVSQIEKFYSAFFPKWKKEAYYELLKKLQVLPSQKLSTMSCGQRSQVALGLLFAQDPDLLILDDFSMGLDPGYRRLFVEYLREYASAENKTVFLTSHIIQDMELLIDDPGDGFKLEADEDFWHPSALCDKWEVYSFLPKAEVEQRLKAMGVTEITEENLSLEDAFIGLTGKY